MFFEPTPGIMLRKPEYLRTASHITQNESLKKLSRVIYNASYSINELNEILNFESKSGEPDYSMSCHILEQKLKALEQHIAQISIALFDNQSITEEEKNRLKMLQDDFLNEVHNSKPLQHSKLAESMLLIKDFLGIVLSLVTGLSITALAILSVICAPSSAALSPLLLVPFVAIMDLICVAGVTLYSFSAKTHIRFVNDKQIQEINEAIDCINNFDGCLENTQNTPK